MRLSKEEIAKQFSEKEKKVVIAGIDTLVNKYGGENEETKKVLREALEEAEAVTKNFIKGIKGVNSNFRDEVTATCNSFKYKIADKIADKAALLGNLQKVFDEIRTAVSKGEFKQEAKTSTAKKFQTAKAPKDTANTFQKFHFDESGYLSTPNPKTELGSQIANKFFQFEQSLKEQGIKLSINAINAIKIKRNNLVSMASFPKTADTAIQKTDEQLAIYAEHIKQGNLQEHLLNSMIAEAYKEIKTLYGKIAQIEAQTQTTEQKAPQAKKDEIFDDKAIQKSEERTAVNAAWQEAKKAWIEEGKNGVLQHISDDYTKLTNLAQQSNTLQEFKDGFAKLDAEVKADAQNPERVSKTYPKTEKYATKATAPKSEPQVSNEPEPTAHQTQFGNGEDSAAMNELKANPPQNTQTARQDNKVSYSRAAHRQTQPNA